MRIAVIKPGEAVQDVNISGDLASMQEVVGGYIQTVPAEWMREGQILRGLNLILVMDEEGKLKEYPPNFWLREGRDYAAGTCFVCKQEGENLVGIDDAEFKIIRALFADREEPAEPSDPAASFSKEMKRQLPDETVGTGTRFWTCPVCNGVAQGFTSESEKRRGTCAVCGAFAYD